MMLMMVFWMIVPLLLIVAAVTLGSRLHSDQTVPTQPSVAPMEILKERYARGEISREEYENLRRGLEG